MKKILEIKKLEYQVIKLIPTRMFLKMKFRMKMRKKLDLKHPKTFNEKLQWMKLYDKKNEYINMVDKYEVKKYVSNLIGKKYIIPTLGIYEKFDDIDFEKLPNQFVIKCTHDSGGLVICRDKLELDMKIARKKINDRLKQNYFYIGREWPYKNVKPRIIVEKYLEEEPNKQLKDYKFFCFNGQVKYLYISEGLENHKTAQMMFFDCDFNISDIQRSDYKKFTRIPKKPVNFELMKKYSEILSKGIPHVRVDWYEVRGKLYFGELTFYTCSGFVPFENEKYDFELGELIKII